MSSFADLKNQRGARQTSRASKDEARDSKEDSVEIQEETPSDLAAPTGASAAATHSEAGPSRIAMSVEIPAPDAQKHPQHALFDFPAGIELRSVPGRGRGLFATRSYRPGQVVFSCTPCNAVLSSPLLSEHCTHCGLSPVELETLKPRSDKPWKMNRCGGCKVVHYCSGDCQKSDWPAHAPECKAHAKLRTQFLLDKKQGRSTPGLADDSWVQNLEVRSVGRICWARKRARDENGGRDPRWWAQMKAMQQSAMPDTDERMYARTKTMQRLLFYLALPASTDPAALWPASPADYGFGSLQEIADLFDSIALNSFALSSTTLAPLGIATEPRMAMFNHSCQSNAALVFPRGSREMRVVAVRPIEAGDEITQSYVDPCDPRHKRQRVLKDTYGFTCACPLCEKDKQGVSPRWAIKHPGCKKQVGTLEAAAAPMPDLESKNKEYPVKCQVCGEGFTVDVPALRNLIRRTELVSGEQPMSSPHPSSSHSPDILPLSTLPLLFSLSSFLPPTSYPLFQLIRHHYNIAPPPSSIDEWSTAVQFLARATAAIAVLGEGEPANPVRGVMMAEEAKMWGWGVDEAWAGQRGSGMSSAGDASGRASKDVQRQRRERLRMCIVKAKEALAVASAGFGTGSFLEKEMQELMASGTAELAGEAMAAR